MLSVRRNVSVRNQFPLRPTRLWVRGKNGAVGGPPVTALGVRCLEQAGQFGRRENRIGWVGNK